jgi:cytochrome d ubiquinol oxidase subunit II
MSVVAVIVAPIVLLYQGWTYHVFRARVGGAELPSAPAPASPGEAGSSTAA